MLEPGQHRGHVPHTFQKQKRVGMFYFLMYHKNNIDILEKIEKLYVVEYVDICEQSVN